MKFGLVEVYPKVPFVKAGFRSDIFIFQMLRNTTDLCVLCQVENIHPAIPGAQTRGMSGTEGFSGQVRGRGRRCFIADASLVFPLALRRSMAIYYTTDTTVG